MFFIPPRRPDDIPIPKKHPPMPDVTPPKPNTGSDAKKSEKSNIINNVVLDIDNELYIKDENVLKFYYCKSEDDYFLGQRVDNFYYARYDKECMEFVWCLSRHLPWGQHIVDKGSLWKEHTYPSEPVEIGFNDWLKGFIQKYYPQRLNTGICYEVR